jgi:hypothetical protein
MTTSLPTFSTYCPNTTAANALVFDLGNGFRVWYSYKTPVAFSTGNGRILVRENEWGPTTGKHLNAIDRGEGGRVPGAEFEELLGLAQDGGKLVAE